jgi:hypothetical protein
VTQLNLAVDRIATAHRMLKSVNISDAECEKNVADAVCKVSIPACSKDQTKVVSFLSKQDCREIMGWWVLYEIHTDMHKIELD